MGFLARGDREYYRDLLGRSIPHRRPATLLDLGCGTALLGAWLAQQLRLDLVSLDFSPVATSLASRLTSHLTTIRKTFLTASFDSTGLDANSLAAAFSLDAVYLASNPATALREVRRVMKQGAPLIFTYFLDSETKYDWPRMVRRAGFNILSVTDISTVWRQHMSEKHLCRWRNRHRILKELGSSADAELSVSASMLGLAGHRPNIASTSRYLVYAISA